MLSGENAYKKLKESNDIKINAPFQGDLCLI
jgi:hypothetical protein